MIPNFRQTPNSTSVPLTLAGSSTFGKYAKISVEKTFNMFLSDEWLVNFAGYTRVLRFESGTLDASGAKEYITAGEGRGIFHSIRANIIVVVINEKVFVVDANLGATPLPLNLSTASGEVFMDENLHDQICIVDGTNAYIYNYTLPANLTLQTGAPFGTTLTPNFVSYHNTYFLFGNALTNSDGHFWFAFSRLADTTIVATTDGINTFAVETKPDFALAVIRLPSQSDNVLVFGRAVIEMWSQVGGVQNYRRVSTINIDSGCTSISTIASSEDSVFWLGRTQNNAPVIMRFRGNNHEQISSDGIDKLLQDVVEPESSTAAIYRQDGHIFYQLTFFGASDNFTIIYDLDTEKFFNLTDQYLNYHPARETVYFNGKWLFVGINKPFLYEQSTDFFVINESFGEDADEVAAFPNRFVWDMQYIRICNSIRNDTTGRFRLNSLSFPIQQGFDPQCTGGTDFDYIVMEDDITDIITTETGSEMVTETSIGTSIDKQCPRIDLSFSKDGGYTWSNTFAREMQELGHRRNIVTFKGLGSCNEIVCKFRFWIRSPVIVGNGMAEVY